MALNQKLIFGGEEPQLPIWRRPPTSYRDLSVMFVAKELIPHPLIERPHSLKHVHKSLCPFHKENTPSAVFRPIANTFTCYGCGKYGGAIYLASELSGDILTYLESRGMFNRKDSKQVVDLISFLEDEEGKGRLTAGFSNYIFI